MNPNTNLVLNLLWTKGGPWAQVIEEMFPDLTQRTKAKQSVVRFYQRYPTVTTNPTDVRAIIGSPNKIIRNSTTLLPSEISEIITTLKEQKRVLQLGSGKGRGIVIFNNNPIIIDNDTGQLVDAKDPEALFKALKIVVINSTADIEALREADSKKAEIIASQQKKIEELNEEVLRNNQKSWL